MNDTAPAPNIVESYFHAVLDCPWEEELPPEIYDGLLYDAMRLLRGDGPGSAVGAYHDAVDWLRLYGPATRDSLERWARSLDPVELAIAEAFMKAHRKGVAE